MRRKAEHGQLLQGLRILVADDEIIIALDIEATLSEAGAEVVGPFGTLRQTLEAAAIEPLSAAILDIRLGKVNTGPVAEKLVARRIPFLFYSGQSLPQDMLAYSGAHPVLSKPAGNGAFVRALLDLVGRD